MYSNNDYRYYLAHHGIMGMHWGVRRYQNADGTYTNAGEARRMKAATKYNKKAYAESAKARSSKTRLMRAYHTQNSRNYRELAKYHKAKASGQKVSRLGMTYHRLSGRKSTVGRALLGSMFTPATISDLAKDARYLHNNKKKQTKATAPRRSLKGNLRRAYAGVFDLNYKTHKKLGNRALASMNAAERNRQLKLAEEADLRKRSKRR